MADTTQDVAVPEQRNSVETLPPGALGRFDESRHTWDMLKAEAIGLGGAELLEGKNGDGAVDYLEKVPHIIVGVAFYQGDVTDNGHDGAFVALKAMIAPESVLEKRFRGNQKTGFPAHWSALPFYPDDVVLYNDGGTGIYRQVVEKLADNDYIALPDPVIIGGGKGESSSDLHPGNWAGIDKTRAFLLPNKDDGSFGGVEFNIRINAPRGIRYSDYTNESGKSRTRYIA